MTAVDLTPGATLSNGGEITTDGRIGIGGAVSQYPVTGEVPALYNVVSTPGNPGFSCVTGYGGVVPDHSHVAGGTQASPTAPGANTIFRDMAGRLFWDGKFGGSSATFQYKTTEAVTSTYTGCMASLQLTPNGGTRRETHLFYGSGDFIQPVSGSRLIVGASSLSGMSNHSGIITPLTQDAGNIGFAVGYSTAAVSMYVGVVSGAGFNYANTALYLGKDANTGRSINAGGTVNASGADYAEYERKAESCGDLIPGQIIGFDANGLITDKWDDSISFGVVSTNPSFVGGDDWKDAASVERVAYCGKVPVNVTGAKAGDYIIAEQDGDGIGGGIVTAWFANTVGRVRRILEDGRAEIAVM